MDNGLYKAAPCIPRQMKAPPNLHNWSLPLNISFPSLTPIKQLEPQQLSLKEVKELEVLEEGVVSMIGLTTCPGIRVWLQGLRSEVE